MASLVGHEVMTVQGLGWAGTLNGELLKRTAGVADAFVTMDRKLERQHDLTKLPFGVVVIAARSNKMQDLLPLVDALQGPWQPSGQAWSRGLESNSVPND